MKISDQMKAHWAAIELQKFATRYLNSNKQTDVECGNIINNIAEDLITKKYESAKIRFDALHPDIKSGFPFHILDVLDKCEYYGK